MDRIVIEESCLNGKCKKGGGVTFRLQAQFMNLKRERILGEI